ncbi:MAG: hypothetical protein II970_02720 [Paludibacteraceae bacterium]|nr:hypothetical protein [Paludibacteraceae bacterium]
MKRAYLHIVLRTLLAVCLLVAAGGAFAQGRRAPAADDAVVLPVTTEGTDFWVAFPKLSGTKIDDASLSLSVMVTASEAVQVIVAQGVTGDVLQTLDVAAGGYQEFRLTPGTQPTQAYLDESETPLPRSLHIYAQDKRTPFSCFAYCEAGTSGSTARDATLMIPERSLGLEYIVQTYPQDGKSTGFVIVATDDETTVQITPNAKTFTGNPAQSTFSKTLNRGESLLVASSQPGEEGGQAKKDTMDMSGSRICSNKPVAVYTTNEEVKVPMSEAVSSDFMMEQVPPLTGLGTTFYVAGSEEQKLMYCLVTALYDGTEVTETRYNKQSGRTTERKTTLRAGTSWNVPAQLNEAITDIVIKSTEPVLCYTYFSSALNNTTSDRYDEEGNKIVDRWSDPANAMVASWEQRVQDITFYSRALDFKPAQGSSGEQHHFVQVTVPTAETGLLQLDGTAVNAELFRPYGGDETMSYACIPLTKHGGHRLTTEGEGFVGTVYGFADGIAYLYTLGYRPDAHPDSLFITNEEAIMSKRSYDLERMEQGWYQRQLKEWPREEERLDTAVVCDSTIVHFLVQSDRHYKGFVWEVWLLKGSEDKELVTHEEIATSDRLVPWEHRMVVDDEQDLQPEKRQKFAEYEIRGAALREYVICPDDQPYGDTLKTIVRVLRAYNDTVRRIVCTGDSIRFFRDKEYDYAPAQSYMGAPGEADSTVFVADSVACKRGEHKETGDHRFKVGLGLHRFTRYYESLLGCDSLVTFELYVCPTPDTTRIDTTLLHDRRELVFPETENTMFAGQTIDKPGVYIDRLTGAGCQSAGFVDTLFHGCDSIIQLRVHLRDTLETFFCDTTQTPDLYGITAEEFVWEGHLTDAAGNDLQVKDVTTGKTIYGREIADNVHIGETHTFQDYYRTADGCDSNYVLVLTREEREIVTKTDAAPNIRTYTWTYEYDGISGSISITPDETWRDTLVIRNAKGYRDGHCPVIFHLEVTFREAFYDLRKDTICAVDTMMYRGRIYAGEKYLQQYPGATFKPDSVFASGKRGRTHEFCVDKYTTVIPPPRDSLFYLQLHVKPSFEDTSEVHLCDYDVIEWNGKYFAGPKADAEGYNLRMRFPEGAGEVEFDTIFPPTEVRCDSACHVTFHIHTTRVIDLPRDTSVCRNEGAFVMGATGQLFTPRDSTVGAHVYSAFVDTVRFDAEEAEDPAYCYMYTETWHVRVAPYYSGDEDARYETRDTICRDTLGAYYEWAEHLYVQGSGEYRTLYTAEGSRLSAGEVPIDRPGEYVYYDSLKTAGCPECSAGGCDSVWKLHLTVLPSYYHEFRHTMSEEQVYTWEGIGYGGVKSADGHDITVTQDTVIESHHDVKTGSYVCDSTVILHLRVGRVYRDTVYDFVCEACSYDWLRTMADGTEKTVAENLTVEVGETIFRSDPYKTVLGFDSVFVLCLTGMPAYNKEYSDTVCQADMDYIWTGHDAAEHNMYIGGKRIEGISARDSGWVVVTDSLKTLALFEDPHGINSRQTACDSIWTLRLYVSPTYNGQFNKKDVTDADNLCSNETFLWERALYVGPDYNESVSPLQDKTAEYDTLIRLTPAELARGMRYDTIFGQTRLGCDSLRFLELTLHSAPFVMLRDTIGDNNTTWEFGRGTCEHITGSMFHVGDYTVEREIRKFFFVDTITLPTGCDSIVHDSLWVMPSYRFDTAAVTCSSVTFDWRKYKELNAQKSGFFYDSLRTIHGVDSVFVLNLTVIPNFRSKQLQQMCKNDTLDWHQKKIFFDPSNEHDLTTLYFADYHRPGACDSLYELEMKYYDYYHYDAVVDSVCQKTPYRWFTGGREHTRALRDEKGNVLTSIPTDTVGWITIYDSLHTTTPCHCDSTYTLHLFVKPAYYYYDTIDICSNETAKWHGREYSSPVAREIRDTLPLGTGLGCDSIYYVYVRVHQAYYYEDETVICGSQLPYHWDGHPQIIGISAIEALTWEEDSVFVLWDSCMTTVHGCDSVYRRQVTVKPIRHTWLADTICEGDTLLFHNHRLTTHGSYTDTLINKWGCDSMVTMRLATKPVTQFNMGKMPRICSDDAVFDIPYTYKGQTPVAYMVRFDTLAKAQGFADIDWTMLGKGQESLPIPLPASDDRTRYPRPDNYSAMVYFDNGYCLDSTLLSVPVEFTLLYPSWLMEQHWNDVIGLLTDSLNGYYSFSAFQWYKDDEPMIGETKPYLYCPQYLEEGANYSVALTRADDSLTFMTCPIVPDLTRPQELTPSQPYVAVVPTLVVKENPVVNILCVNQGTYRIYDAFGIQYDSGTFVPGIHNAYEVRLPETAGVYMFHLIENSGLERTVKVLVE